MVSCSASGCSNRGEKGYSMKSFPRDPVIRKKWQENMNRSEWQPTRNSKLCEAHFLPEMWEKPRVDGKKKLKWDAIPTIFPQNRHNETKSKISKDTPEYCAVANETTQTEINSNYSMLKKNADALFNATFIDAKDHNINSHPNSFVSQSANVLSPSCIIVNVDNPALFDNYSQPPSQVSSASSKNSQGIQVNQQSILKISSSPKSSSIFSDSFVSDVNVPSTLNNTDLFKKIYQYQKAYTQLLAKVNSYKDQVKNLKHSNEQLLKVAKKDRHLRLLKHVFNDDQICALDRTNCRFMKWTQTTLVNALRLKNYCGTDGYEEILRQKIPLPSIRTLNRIKTVPPMDNTIVTQKCSP